MGYFSVSSVVQVAHGVADNRRLVTQLEPPDQRKQFLIQAVAGPEGRQVRRLQPKARGDGLPVRFGADLTVLCLPPSRIVVEEPLCLARRQPQPFLQRPARLTILGAQEHPADVKNQCLDHEPFPPC